MNNTILSNITRFVLLLIAQVLIFNNLDILSFINPYPYILFIILYPADGNKPLLYLSSFLLGLTVDMFENSGGIHAAASLVLAFSRPSILKFAFGVSYQYHNLNIYRQVTRNIFSSSEVLTYLILCIAIHHITLFTLEFLRFNFFLEILVRSLLTTIATFICCVLILYLIKPSKK